jgi:hypothetical protein
MVPVAQFGKTWAVTFRFKPFPVAHRKKERERDRDRDRKRGRKEEAREGLGDMSTIPLSQAGSEGWEGQLAWRSTAWLGSS